MTTNTTYRDVVHGTGVYKDRIYGVMWIGDTKHGRRAKLCWLSSPTNTFWVDAELVHDYQQYPIPVDPEDLSTDQRPRSDEPRREPAAELADPDGADERDEDRDDETAAVYYCSHCGQMIPG